MRPPAPAARHAVAPRPTSRVESLVGTSHGFHRESTPPTCERLQRARIADGACSLPLPGLVKKAPAAWPEIADVNGCWPTLVVWLLERRYGFDVISFRPDGERAGEDEASWLNRRREFPDQVRFGMGIGGIVAP